MKELNNKGFTLVEIIAVVAIITILSIILIPNVTKLINEQKGRSVESIKDTVLIAAKQYINDNKYNIVFNGDVIEKINDSNGNLVIAGNEITVSKLIELGYLTPTKGERIAKPDDKNKCLDDNYGVSVEWNNKSFTFTPDELIWESCN